MREEKRKLKERYKEKLYQCQEKEKEKTREEERVFYAVKHE